MPNLSKSSPPALTVRPPKQKFRTIPPPRFHSVPHVAPHPSPYSNLAKMEVNFSECNILRNRRLNFYYKKKLFFSVGLCVFFFVFIILYQNNPTEWKYEERDKTTAIEVRKNPKDSGQAPILIKNH